MDSIENRINYHFETPSLLVEALTHASKRHETSQKNPDNQRLEFLGDAVIQLIFTEKLFHEFSEFREGLLTKLRIRLVSRKALASFANKLELGNYLDMGKGEIASGGRTRISNLADGFEALIGAIYLDGGIQPASRIVFDLAEAEINEIENHPEEDNPKGELQELLQSIAPCNPEYKVIGYKGTDHCRTFTTHVIWGSQVLGEGSGLSKKDAAIDAARKSLRNPSLHDLLDATAEELKQLENKSENSL